MKKFAKILGFLGFFVTVATVQIGTAWAESVECRRGYYLRRGETTCTQCPSAAENNGIGVFCPGNEGEPYEAPAEYDYGIFPCKDQKECSTDYTYDLTPAMATSRDQCKSRCNSAECIHPNSLCPLPNDGECQYQEDNAISGYITCGGTCTAEYISDNYCPVTCPTSCNNGTCTCPNDDCTGFDVENNLPGVHYCGTAANACDVTHLIQGENTSNAQIISANNYQCSAYGDCKRACSHEGNPTCPYPGTTCEWDLNTPVQEGYQQGDDCIDPVTNLPIEDFPCNIITTGCTNPCQYWDGKECISYTTDVTYKCGDTTQPGPTVTCGRDYFVNRNPNEASGNYVIDLDTSGCVPAGKVFSHWILSIDNSQHSNDDRFAWNYTDSEAKFEAEWGDKTYYISYNLYNGNFVSGNGPLNNPEPFTTADLEMNIKWTAERQNSSFKGWCDAPYYDQNATWLSQHCVETIASSNQWFQIDNNNLPALLNGGDTVHLYAWWECTGPYTLNSNYLCEGDKIDVKYTCHAPENSSYNDTSYTYNNAATYGQEYRPVKSVEDVAEESNPTACQFAGYEIDPDQANTYEWTLLGSTSNSPTDGKYRPGSSMNEWQYISPTPTTEIEFELKSDVWKAKKYSVQYRCGDIKPGADVYTDSSATYGQTYSVAGQFDPIGGNVVTVQDFLDTNCKPEGGFGAWTFQNWTFTCPGANSGPYNTNDPTFGTWTYDSNNCYFTANWAQTDFVIILDSNIDQDPMNNGSDVSDPEELYTRLNYKVYSCPERTNSCEMGSLTAIPTKVVIVTLNGNGGQFTWNNETVSEVTDDSKFTFLGFYESEESNSDQYIYGEDDANSGLITNRGKEVGIGYDGTNIPYIWHAHWENRNAVILPEPIERPGFTFNGWLCAHEELAPGVDPTLYNGGDPILNGSFVPEDNATCTALWTEACYEIEFNDNGGTPSSNGTHPSYYKKHNDNKWYTNATCASVDYDPTVANNMPSKEHATFTGYYDETQNPDLKIFAGTNDTPQGGLTSDGAAWTVSDNAILYAQYKCDEPYHLDTDSESGTYGQCVACDPGFFYDPTESNPAKQCKNCDEYIHDHGASGSSAYTWTSKDPYNWSINQCYRVCNSKKCTAKNFAEGHRIEQFVTLTQEDNDWLGNQISFYGNEFNNSNQGQNFDACANNEFEYCPQGLLADSGNPDAAAEALKTISAPVKFYGKCDDNGIDCEELSDRYIVGNRGSSDGLVVLQNGFAWSHSVGEAQLTGIPSGNRYTVIIYPTDAPTPSQQQNMTFTGYRYPRMGTTAAVTTNGVVLDGAIAGAIITYAGQHDYQDMSPIVYNNNYTRNLYAQYTAADSYTLTYNCGEGGGIPPAQQTNIYAGNNVSISVPSNCSHYSTHSLTEWAVTATEGGQRLETVPAGTTSFTWDYDRNVTFTAVWGNANTHRIIYNKIPVDDVNTSETTENGNTYVPGVSGGTPTQFTCGSGTTPITGQPQLKNSDGDVIGEVKQWCDNDDLSSGCALPKTISHTSCENKNVYAKWECDAEAGYYLNSAGNDCITCEVGYYWDNGTCRQCPDGWTSNPPYNWTINQCYKLCNGSNNTTIKYCSDDLTPNLRLLPFFANKFLDQGGTPYQITFYGNHQNNINVCAMEDVEYCPAVLRALAATGLQTNKTKASKITFMRQGNMAEAGERYIVGFLDANGDYNGNGNFWSHIAGQGQQVTEGDDTYTRIIYPTDTAPSPDSTPNPAFKGYFDGTGSNATQRVAAALGLDSSNAVAFAQTPLLENQIGDDRTLYPQYCENGQEWDPSANGGNGACITPTQVYDVKYVCGEHGTPAIESEMTNTATSGQPYMVAALEGGVLAACTANTGYVLKTNNSGKPLWYFNGDSSANHYTGEVINQWNFNTQSPKFTAQYDCDDGYTWQDGECKPGTNLCNADFPSGADSHAHIINTEYVNGQCVYEIQCAPCGDGTYGCYDHEGDQLFDITLDPSILVLPDTSFCTPEEYSISYDDTQRTLHFNVDTGTCSPTSYLYGNTINIDCRLNAPNDSHAVFKGWCAGTNTSTGCAETQSISATDYGDKTYYAWWDCDQNYHQNGLTCDPDGNLPLIYKPNGGQLNEDYTVLLSYGQEFSTEGAIYTKTGNILARWDVAAGGANTFNSHFDDTTNTYYAELGEYYSRGYLDTTTTLNAHWEACQCDIGTGVASCNANVVTENACTPEVTCQTGYTNPHIECTGTYNTICRVTCDAEGQYEIILSKNFTVGQNGPHGEYSNQLYTIHDTGVYRDYEREDEMTETTNPLTSLPNKYYTVTFNHCDRDNDTYCSNPVTTSEIENAYFTLLGFYANYDSEDPGYRYIKQTNNQWFITNQGITAGKNYDGVPADYTWYAQWNGNSGTLMWNDFPSDPTREGYIFDGWWTQPGETGTRIETDYIAYNDTTLYAHWTVNSCDDGYILVSNSCVTPQDCKPICSVNCTYPGQSNGVPSNSAACPNGTNYSNLVVSCNYDTTSNSQGGYYEPTESITKCRKTENCDLITASTCRYTPNCITGYIWNNDANDCIPDSNQTYTIKFICEEGGNPIVDPQTVHYGENITVPSNSACTNNPGYSYSRWKATTTGNHPTTLNAQSSTYQYPWEQTHGETFIADWNDGNVYHVNLHAYSCDDPTNPDLTGTFNSYTGVQELWEKYNVAWYKNAGLDDQITTLSSLQLPTLSGWMFGGYNKTDGMPRLSCDNGTCENLSPTLIRNNEDWCAVWSKCNANEYWNNGDCISCSTATGGQYPYAAMGATSINDCYNRPCYRDCQPNFSACNIPHAETYTYVNESFIGSMYYPNTNSSACQLDIWLPETSGTVPNCQCRVATCETGYHPNNDNTACVPNNYMITLNSHIDGFNGHASSPEVLYTKYGPNGGAYLDSTYTYLMNDERPLYAVPVKSADVILNGNGGNVIWNGYSSSTATLTATFDFQGFYPSVYGGNQYISDTGYISPNGNSAAQQNQSNSTVWHAQWQDGSITLPDAQRQCYTFGGWWTDMYNGVPAGNANMPYTPTGATTNLYAHWTPGTYSITYHNGNAIYSGCSTTSYTFGNAVAINCSITPQAGSHKVFNGWCTNPGLTAGCTQNPVISNTDCGDKDYYAWWGCESGYNMENGVCVPNAFELCPAQLPSNSHATLATDVTPNPSINQNGDCVYTVQCNSCINENSAYDCYVYSSGNINSTNTNGRFTITGAQGTAGQNVLNNVICEPATYTAVYRCGDGTPTNPYYDTDHIITYNGSYTVLPNGTENGGVVTCSKDGERFNHWKFNLDSGRQYTGGDPISPWRYHGATVPTFMAQYGQCPEDEVLVDGDCKPMCTKDCIYPGANPGACPSNYPINAICAYDPSSYPVIGYRPSPYSNKCLDVDYPHDPVVANQCEVTEVTCPTHYEWNPVTLKCDPKIYQVRLDANGGATSFGFVSKLFEKYNEGWGKNETGSFTPNLQLSSSELPTGADISQIFTGYGINCNSTARMISADGTVLASPTTLVGNDQTWYACYGPNTSATFKVRFKCNVNEPDVIPVQEVHVGESINVPAMGVCPGVAFNQWKSTLNQSVITLPAGAIGVQWNHYFDEVFVPDTKAVYRVDLNANGGTFPSNDYRQLWYAVDMGWYKDERLAQADRITFIPGDQLPIKTNSNFNGWLDNATQQPRGNFSGTNWNLPNSISANETWNAQWGPCNPNEYWDGGVCKNCSDQTSGAFPYAVPGATSIGQCYNTCDEQCKWNNSIAASCNIPNAISYEPDEISYPGKRYYNNQLVCSLDIWAPNPQGTIPNCGCIPTACEPGYVLSGDVCVEREKHIITLDSHIIHGSNSDPDVLYTWEDRGVYLDSNYIYQMTRSSNPLDANPRNYARVTFNLGASDAIFDQNYVDVPLGFLGFYKSMNSSTRYIDDQLPGGFITQRGMDDGEAYTNDATWYAQWQPRALGTVMSDPLPEPSRPGFEFAGWWTLSVGGAPVTASTVVDNDMTVYARWSDRIYTVNLVSDRNNCQQSNNTPTKLYEKYNVGWNRNLTGTFDRDLLLNDDELPTPNAGYVFDGYYDAPSGGQRVIRSDGRVIQEPNYTDDTHTWYARCVRPNGPFTVTFKCDTDGHVVQSGSVNHGANVTAPTVADANCTKPGHTFNKWKAMVNNENIVFNAGGTYSWVYYSGADFVPNWTASSYNVKYMCNGVTVATNSAAYGTTYTVLNHNGLSGCTVPAGKEFGGWGFSNDGIIPYLDEYSDGDQFQWNYSVPKPTFTAIWSNCEKGEYWDGYKCYPCPGEFTDNPHAIGIEQCYKECTWYCTENGCPGTQPTGMSSCTYGNVSGNGIQYNVPGATCQLQGQPNFPQNSCQACTDCCPMNITCDKGYDLVGCECRDNRYTITLDSNLYNDNGTPANPSTLYTWFNHGVYRDFARTLEMTPNENPLAVGTPSTFATVTLNGNGAYFNWHNQYGPQLQDNVDFVFDGFYDTTGAAIDPVIGIDRHITEAGQSIGTTAQNNQTWRASWRNGSVDLPSISRDGYTFDGWWTECNGGTRVSMGNQTITVSGDITLCAHWVNKSYTVTYNCDSEGGQGGTATDSRLAYQNTTYTVRENFIPCHKDANVSNGTRYHEFENWKFNLDPNTYWPGDSIMWIFNADNPTFNAHYKECPNGWYFDGSCKQCPDGYTSSDIDADSATKCYKTCDVQCTQPTSQCPMNEEGVLTCTYPNNTYPLGKQYSGSDDCIYDGTAPACEPFTIMCKPGYTPDYYLSTDTGTHCTKLADHEITLAANCGHGTVIPGNQEKLYTTENTGVYLDPARTNTYQMGLNRNPLVSGDWARCIVTATFNHCDNNDPNCDGATTEQKTVDLGFNGYYKAETNGTRYTDTRQEDGQLKSYITQQGIDAGKGYTANATWFAQWLDGRVGSQKWPSAPTRTGTCGVTYEFVDWYTAANGGNVVLPDTQVSEDVTWYAHWCESCPTGTIDHGSCNAPSCKATFTCDNGYVWDETQCQCVATGLTLTYDLAGGTASVPTTYTMTFGQSFTTLGDNDVTKPDQVNCEWVTTNDGGGSFPLLDHLYTYNVNSDTTLQAHWVNCRCNPGNGVANCSMSVENNACVPTFECKDRFVTNDFQVYTCTDDCNPACTVNCTECPVGWISNEYHSQCIQCEAGTYQVGNECKSCPEGFTSNAGATSCYGNTITIDWDENGGNAISNGSCVYGQMFTLANAPEHSNRAMQFLGWKLFTGDSTYPAGTNDVMCTYDNVGVYSGTSTKIQAQWNECKCNYSEEDHVQGCWGIYTSGICMCSATCMPGYELIDNTYTCNPECRAKTSNITYECGEGTGTPAYLTDSATFDANYIVKGRGTCQMTGFNFAGWKLSANSQTYQPGYRFEPWNFTQQNPTFTAQYTNIQCASDEILIGNDCVKCNCTIGTGATSTSCGMLSTNSNTCEWTHPVECLTGFVTPAWSCTGTGNTNCTASCSVCPENQVEVGGSCVDCECTPDTTTGAVSCGTRSVSNNMCNWGPAICTPGHHNPNITCSGSSNQSCEATCGTCPANTYGPDGLECIQCPDGYTSPAGSTSIEDCYNNPTPYTITYQPNGGMNNGVLGQPVIQNVTYGDGFITKPGTIFTKENSIITAWDHVEGGDYPELNRWYVYDTDIDTILDAHWEQCTCTADNCTTSATDSNTCACSATCPTGYTYGGCNCNGTVCAPTCTQCAETEISINNECVECECTPGAGAATCGTLSTIGNICEWTPSCLDRFVNVNANCTGIGNTTCNPTCTECPAGWISNANHTECEICPANTYQSGNTCVDCPTGYTSPAGSSSVDACVPGAHTIHYLSNNGTNETYNQGVYYGQSFRTEGGTRFTYTNHIMTRWNVESGASSTFTNGTATLSGNYVYNDTTDTTLGAQWSECGCTEGEGVVAGSCTTSVTDNLCGCSASCDEGFEFVECKCNGTTNCVAICNKVAYKADYECGSGEGIPPLSDDVHYGDTYTIKANAEIYGCHRENSTFAGWEFDGDQARYWPGTPIEWNYFAGHKFRAVYCYNCPTIAHGTCELEMPTAGQCDWNITCDMGYKLNETKDNCVPISVTLEYQSNGGTPVAGYTYEYAMSYGDGFRTLDGGAFEKSRHIFNEWQTVGLGGSFPKLNWDYTYNYAGNTTLQPNWTLCPDNTISLNNQCQQCQCTENEGVTSCTTSATNDDTCSCSGECAAGYINAGCNCNGTNCTQSCTKCADNQVSVNNVCEDCVCNVNDDSGATSCGTKSVIDNMCNWGPATCRPGYAYPTIICDGSNNQLCEASCTICPAGTYGDNGVECKPCPEGKTSLPGATSIRECFIDPNSCAPDEHIEHGECVSNTRACSIPDATNAVRIWNPAIGTYGPCTVEVGGCNSGYHVSGNVCVKDTEACTVEHGHGEHDWNGTSWGACGDVVCDPGYEPNSDYTACVECSNRRVNGDIAVSGYIYECEIAACMYQGQKYALQNGECVPICENASDETGTKVWDERTKKCIRTCNPGYKMW